MAKQTLIRVFCAWCGKYMGDKDGQGQTGASHGMCPKCYKKLMETADATTNKK